MKKWISFVSVLCLLTGYCQADEGMWIPMLLKKYNIEDMQKKGFRLTAEDVYDINKASLKDAVVGLGREGSPFKTAYDVMNNWGANHGAISYGHIGADLITMCSMLRIPVAMHNVPADDIFRPAAWNAFGMDKEGADYRACSTYGPIYK